MTCVENKKGNCRKKKSYATINFVGSMPRGKVFNTGNKINLWSLNKVSEYLGSTAIIINKTKE